MTARLIERMSAAEYLSDPAEQPSLSASIAHMLCSQSPAHAKAHHPRLSPETYVHEEAEYFDIGTTAHALMLEGVGVAEVLDFPDWRTKAAREARIAARFAGKVPILQKHWLGVLEMVAAGKLQLAVHREAANAFFAGKPEQTIIWEEQGITCRARLDWLHDDHRWIDDYKTGSTSANPAAVTRTLYSNGWDVKAAFYIRALKALDPECNPTFRFIVQETYRPYALCVVGLGPETLALADKKVQYAIETWQQCLESGVWPAYPDRICWAELPGWAEEGWLRKELEGAV